MRPRPRSAREARRGAGDGGAAELGDGEARTELQLGVAEPAIMFAQFHLKITLSTIFFTLQVCLVFPKFLVLPLAEISLLAKLAPSPRTKW